MKVLLLSNTAGQGHQATADAIREMLISRGADCRLLDTYAYVNPALYETISKGYLVSTSLTPGFYGRAYRLAELSDSRSQHALARGINSMFAIRLQKYLREFNPDVIICTHIFSAQIIEVMKRRGHTKAVVIGVITDFTIHPFWRDVKSIDYFVTASELLALQAVNKGIPSEKLLPFGIPIREKFSHSLERSEARKQLEIDPAPFTVLLMGGSMGHGHFARIIHQMDRMDVEFQILAVCGNNRSAKHRVDNMVTHRRVYSYGYVDNVDVMMDAADCIVTKPGGLTTSEALAKLLPMVMINPIPGQEERNAEFLLNNGLAVNVTPTFPIDEALFQLFLYPEKLHNMQNNIRLVGKPNATRSLCDFVYGLSTGT